MDSNNSKDNKTQMVVIFYIGNCSNENLDKISNTVLGNKKCITYNVNTWIKPNIINLEDFSDVILVNFGKLQTTENQHFEYLIKSAEYFNKELYLINYMYEETSDDGRYGVYSSWENFIELNQPKKINNIKEDKKTENNQQINDDYKNLTRLLSVLVFDKSTPFNNFSTRLDVDFDIIDKFYKEHTVHFDNIDGEPDSEGNKICTIVYELKDKKKITRKGVIS